MARAELRSLRLSRSDTERLMAALLISLLLHVTVWGGYEVDKKFGWWQAWHLPAWLHKTAKKNPPPLVQTQPEVSPEIFVDVTQSDPEPPKKTIYYSNKNSHAANPDEDKNLNQPKLDGKQKEILRTETAPRLSKPQPAAPPQQQAQPSPPSPPTDAAQSSQPVNPGDLERIKLAENKSEQTEATPLQPQRLRTLKAVREQQHLPGPQMQQDGGVHRQRISPTLDARATPFGEYSDEIIRAVTQRWWDLLDSQKFAQDRTGRVVVRFKIKYDGTIEDVEILDNNVGPLLGYVCQASIEEAAPFAKWPDDMRREIGANFKVVTFTFDYY
jgi:outer membrane biosynthesis protein TonB